MYSYTHSGCCLREGLYIWARARTQPRNEGRTAYHYKRYYPPNVRTCRKVSERSLARGSLGSETSTRGLANKGGLSTNNGRNWEDPVKGRDVGADPKAQRQQSVRHNSPLPGVGFSLLLERHQLPSSRGGSEISSIEVLLQRKWSDVVVAGLIESICLYTG